MNNIQDELDKQKAQIEEKRENVTRILQSHLGSEVTPGNLDFAHQLAQQSASSNQPMQEDRSEAVKRNQDPKSQTEPKGRRGRPRKTQQGDEPPQPMIVNQEGDQQKRPATSTEDSPSKARAKPKRKQRKEKTWML